MAEGRRFGWSDLLLGLLVVAVAGGARAGYLIACADSGRSAGPLRVSDAPPVLDLPGGTEMRGHEHPDELDALVHNVAEHRWFGSLAPFAPAEEQTAHVAPGYPWLLSMLSHWVDAGSLDRTVRWAQCALGALTAGLCFLFARRAFDHLGVATLAGLLAALHPFWVIDTAALGDSVLATVLVALAIWLGARAGQDGGPLSSLLYGLALAGAALVRAALVPFALVAMAWFLYRSRTLVRGWLCAFLAILGFANGLAPWIVRNYQVFGEPVPVVDSAQLHWWVGNNPHAEGGPLTAAMMADVPTADLADAPKQPERYARLGAKAWQEVRADPVRALRRRLQAAFAFLVGRRWFEDGSLAEVSSAGEMPEWLARAWPAALQGTLLGIFALGFLGWRWSYGWRRDTMPSSLAVVWIAIPYVLTHAANLSGPRLPLDSVLLCYSAFALFCLIPGVGRPLFAGSPPERPAAP